MNKEQRKVIDQYTLCVAEEMALTPEIIYDARTRKLEVAKSRKAIIYFIKNDNRTRYITLEKIGELFKSTRQGRDVIDHSTVVHAFNSAKRAMTPDSQGKFTADPGLRSVILKAKQRFAELTGCFPVPKESENIWIREKNIIDQIEFLQSRLQKINLEKRAFYENN